MGLTSIETMGDRVFLKRYGVLLILMGATILSRIPYQAQIPYGLDSIQFVLGIDNYDVYLHQPHPPGYFLFVMAGRLLRVVLKDNNASLVALNIAASGLTVALIYLLGQTLFGKPSGLFSALLMMTSPTVWFHGEVALSNMTDCFLVCLLAFLCWKNLTGDSRFIYLSAVVLGLAGGVRQNTLVFLFPLWIWSIRQSGIKRIIFCLLLLTTTVGSWVLPMTRSSGGLLAYQQSLHDHWINAAWHGISFEWLLFNGVCIGYFIILGTGLGTLLLGWGAILYLRVTKWTHILQTANSQFFLIWIIPSLIFFFFIYSHPIQTGHSLIYLPALILLLPPALWLVASQIQSILATHQSTEETMVHLSSEPTVRLLFPRSAPLHQRSSELLRHQEVRKRVVRPKYWMWISMGILLSYNLTVFLFLNSAVSQRRIRHYEKSVAEIVSTVRSHTTPKDTVLFNIDLMFLGFRDFMYHLPEYQTYQLKPYSISGNEKFFSAVGKKTKLINHIKQSHETKYCVFFANEFTKNSNFAKRIPLNELSLDNFLSTPSGLRLYRGEFRELTRFFPDLPIILREE